VLVVAYAVYARATGTSVRDMFQYLAPIALYVGNWAQSFGVKFPQGIGHTWTLGVEEQFYLVWPAVLMLLLRRSRSRPFVVVVLVAAIAASALIRAWIWRYGGGWPSAYMRTDARADGLLMGALAAFLWRWDVLPRRWVQLAASVALGALVVFVPIWDATSPAMFYGGFTIAAFGCAAMVAAVADGAWRATPVFRNSLLRAIGRVSYGLYLWHVFLLTVVSEQLPDWSPAAQAALGLAATAAATAISWRLVEQPFLRLKSRWSRERSVEVVLPVIPATLA
jgi:peptidoglycan/LPS O-acetylase OafA/YrhL